MKKVIPVLSILLGVYWIIYGFIYGVWIRKGPGGGFFPVIGGALAILFSIMVLVSGSKDKSPSEFTFKAFLPVGGLLVVVLSTYLVGLIIAMALYVFLWLKFMEKYNTIKSISIGVGTSAVIYGIFIIWLSVPLPKGILGLL